ncbi:hypothetical protein HN51_000262 [Arachis hypogaea]|uniref:Uncharacterized protein n=1 Tax=Arachis hypogaea TaxID=3818 RepID=A0A445EWM6_ARAHY|nr:uncharacterized protein LOC112711074 [Arachis hypogaea]QHO48095.1 uncharacterized protein DS421_1g02670 [Arachis hypogaea]RYR79810.1 hypothetical protein Ahy_A01g004614 isoform C [Arachis hypogaea]
MNRRVRTTIPQHHHNFHKYLKPGALARIRDSRIISARSHRIGSICQIPLRRTSPPSSPLHTPQDTTAAQPQANAAASFDGFPFFVARIYGPRCPQRKKLMAAKSVMFVPVSPAADSPDLVIDSFGSDFIVAN